MKAVHYLYLLQLDSLLRLNSVLFLVDFVSVFVVSFGLDD